MPDTSYLIAVVAVCLAVTWALRALPFAALAPLRSSATVHHLSERMPVGVMVILAAYTLHGISPAALLPAGLAFAATLVLHLWRRNAVLSILGGTAVHIVLTSVVLTQT